jgi:hypothetical protein
LQPVITSFLLLLPPFFEALVQAGAFSWPCIVANADCTFRIQWLGYVFGIIYVVVHRLIQGRWRKTPWPLAIAVHPREDAYIYRRVFHAVQAEMRRRELPAIRQMGLDHFPGLQEEFLQSNPAGRVSHGLGHMLKNLRHNQAGRRRLERGRNSRPRRPAHTMLIHYADTLC